MTLRRDRISCAKAQGSQRTQKGQHDNVTGTEDVEVEQSRSFFNHMKKLRPYPRGHGGAPLGSPPPEPPPPVPPSPPAQKSSCRRRSG